jgi:hypothetical protein
MLEFTSLERAVLAAICDAPEGGGEPLRVLLDTARVHERDNTGHGFYTSFDVDRSRPSVALPLRLLDGPNAEVKVGDEVLLMGFILWLKDGYPDCLEGFQYATKTGGSVDLHAEDLGALVLLGPMM